MTLIVDDLLIKPFFSVLNIIHTIALDEMYDVEQLRDDLKENQLLYEVGERPEEEYRRRKRELEDRIEIAEQIRERVRTKMEVKR